MPFLKRATVATFAAVATTAALSPSMASAYTHNWDCRFGIGPYVECADYTGQIYNGWTSIASGFGPQGITSYSGQCIKARTQAGNERDASTCFGGSDNVINLAASPASQAYFYFGNAGRSTNNVGRATT